MKGAAISERYAEALYQVAEKNGEVEHIDQEAEKLLGIFNSNPRLMVLLRSPQIPEAERKGFVRSAMGSASPLLLRILLLLMDKHRIEHLPRILTLFHNEYDRRRGVLLARFVSAKTVDREITRPLQERLERRLRRKVNLKMIQDDRIIGGFVFMTETLLIDASIRRQLEEIRTYLSSRH